MINRESMEKHLNRSGEPVFFLNSVLSTNLHTADLVRGGAVDGTVVIAETQTGGLGRLGRGFYSPPKVGIYMSYVKEIPPNTENLGLTASVAALAVCEAIATCCGIPAKIKWPNDIIINGKKIGGVLTKLLTDTATNRLSHAIIGIGVNVNQKEGEFPPELIQKAGSLRAVYGRQIARGPLCAEIINNLDRFLLREDMLNGLPAPYVKAVKAISCTVGHDIFITAGDDTEPAKALDIAPDGGLVVETAQGVKVIRSGQIEEDGEWSLVTAY